jgi:hypothetical protein
MKAITATDIYSNANAMVMTPQTSRKKNKEQKTFLWIMLFTCVPVYWATLFYIEIVTKEEIEELAIAATVAFFIFFYMGWSMAPLWLQLEREVVRFIQLLLGIIILADIIWLFVHADIQLHGKPAINLLLFWMPFIILSASIGAFVNLVRRTTQP